MYVSNLVVSSFCRKKGVAGVATYLLNLATGLPRKLGKGVLWLSVNKKNTLALRLQDKHALTCSRVANESMWTSSRTDMAASVKKN
jgi:ribosomal protein S18 acetylase RimI-like enzyme